MTKTNNNLKAPDLENIVGEAVHAIQALKPFGE